MLPGLTNLGIQSVSHARRYAVFHKIRIDPLKGPIEDNGELTQENQQEALKNAIAPLSTLPYSEQLDIKNEYISYVISRYFTLMLEGYNKPTRMKGPPRIPRPHILSIIPSPEQHHYRTKDTYMVRPGIDGNPKTVGHIVGRPSHGKYVCVPPVEILSPPHHCQIAQIFQDYIRQSELPACFYFSDGGHWTQIQIRSNKELETMLLIKFHPQQLTQVQIEDETKKLREHFVEGLCSDIKLSSLYFQASPYSNASGKQAPYQLLYGNKHIMETVNCREFALSPGSFFQSNRKMAGIMYEKIFASAGFSNSTSLIDLGCGIGTISILAAPLVRASVGIDISEEAINDAKYNASLNNIFSASFIAGKAEQRIKQALELLQPSHNIVAILNPGRCGVDVSLIKKLRNTPQIGKVIYVACQPDHEWVIRNVLGLIKPAGRTYKSTPFVFKSVKPVDMFPQTVQCEVIMEFER